MSLGDLTFELERALARDNHESLPFSFRHVGECLRREAERFGWAKRSVAPQSMRGEDGHRDRLGRVDRRLPLATRLTELKPTEYRLHARDNLVGRLDNREGSRPAFVSLMSRSYRVDLPIPLGSRWNQRKPFATWRRARRQPCSR